MIWVFIVALVGLGCAVTATALDDGISDSSDAPASPNFRICAPPMTVGPIGACTIEVG